MSELSQKLQQFFKNESILKNQQNRGIFSGSSLPSFIKDWLIKKFSVNGEVDNEAIAEFLKNHIPQHQTHLKGNLMTREGQEIKILARINVIPNVSTGKFLFEIPDVGISSNEGEIPDYLVKKHPELSGGETWGVVSLYNQKPVGNQKGMITITDFQPFLPYQVDLDYYCEMRKKFGVEEWIDVLIRSMEYNPAGFESLSKKLQFISRLLVFVQPNLNMIELAPKSTGKSYIFGNLSKYGWLINGGVLTRAKLFYDMARKCHGIIKNADFVALDEVQTISFSNKDEMIGALKNYLESGTYTVGQVKNQVSTAGLILLGNIPLTEDFIPLNEKYITELPEFLIDSAFLDRFHGFIEGWILPRVNQSLLLNDFALNVEYFTEILHALRTAGEYNALVDLVLDVPKKADTRDVKAIKNLCAGYLKLLFPQSRTLNSLNLEEFNQYCLLPAIQKRGIIRNQIHLIDREFRPDMPDIKITKGSS